MHRRTSWPILGLSIAALAFALDRLSKYVLLEHVMRPNGETETRPRKRTKLPQKSEKPQLDLL